MRLDTAQCPICGQLAKIVHEAYSSRIVCEGCQNLFEAPPSPAVLRPVARRAPAQRPEVPRESSRRTAPKSGSSLPAVLIGFAMLFLFAAIAAGGVALYFATQPTAQPVAVVPKPKSAAESVERIRRSTVMIQADHGRGVQSSGTGFFAGSSGLIVTNAHVIGRSSKTPRSVEALTVIMSGDGMERALSAEAIAIDSSNDLAVLRVTGSDLPPPLTLSSVDNLVATQALSIYGYPLGDALGREISITPTTISSLRREGDTLVAIQIHGGMHPGNSGGPLVNADGEVVGICVAGIKDTQIQFAIPADRAAALLERTPLNSPRLALGNPSFPPAPPAVASPAAPKPVVKNPRPAAPRPAAPDPIPKQTAVKSSDLQSLVLPKSTAPDRSLVNPARNVEGLLTTHVNVDEQLIVADVIWTQRGDAFFVLDSNGTLTRVSWPEGRETRRLKMDRRCCFLALSAEGLLAAMTDLQEVWVIDAETLAVTRRIPAPRIQRVLSGPTLKFAIATGANQSPSRREGTASRLDLVAGEITSQYDVPIQHARITPDGQFYFAQGGIEQLMSYRIANGTLTSHQSTERIAQNGQGICVSPDSKYVCLPSGGGNYGAGYSTHVYRADNLQSPAFTLNSGAYPRVVGFDPLGELVYTQNHSHQLILFSTTAIKRKEFIIPFPGNSGGYPTDAPVQFVAHPAGKKLLLAYAKHLLVVEVK